MDNKSATTNLNRDFIYTIPEKVLFDENITDLDRKIYMIIRSFMDTTGSCYASNNWIATKLKIERRSIIRSLERLETNGYITRFTENSSRYLKINYTNCIEEMVTLESPPSDSRVTPPSDPRVTQLHSKIIRSKKIKNITPLPPKGGCALNPGYEYPDTLYKKQNKTSKNNLAVIIENNPNNIPDELIEEWAQIRKAKITPTVWRRLNEELSKCTCAPIDAFEEMISRGWSTLKAEWINKKTHTASETTFFDHDIMKPIITDGDMF